MTIEIEVLCPSGFSDMNIMKRVLKPGESVVVDPDTYRRMKQSVPSIRMGERKMKLNKGAKKRMQVAADLLEDELKPVDHVRDSPVADWKPVGWYAAQLARNPKEEKDGSKT